MHRREKTVLKKDMERRLHSPNYDPEPRYRRGGDPCFRRDRQPARERYPAGADMAEQRQRWFQPNRDNVYRSDFYFTERESDGESEHMCHRWGERDDRSWSRGKETDRKWRNWRSRGTGRAFRREDENPHASDKTEPHTGHYCEYASTLPVRNHRHDIRDRNGRNRTDRRQWRDGSRDQRDGAPQRASPRSDGCNFDYADNQSKGRGRSPAQEGNKQNSYVNRFAYNANIRERGRSRDRYEEGAFTGRSTQTRDPPTEKRRRVTVQRTNDTDSITQIKVLQKLIKAVYHFRNVTDTENPPISILNMTESLRTFIRPSSPTEHTTKLIETNAKNWGLTSAVILRDHYKQIIDTYVTEFVNIADGEWRDTRERAERWVRRDLGRRLTSETMGHIEALLSAALTPNTVRESQNNTRERAELTRIVEGEEAKKSNSVKTCSTQTERTIMTQTKKTRTVTDKNNRVTMTIALEPPLLNKRHVTVTEQGRSRGRYRATATATRERSRSPADPQPTPTTPQSEEEDDSGLEDSKEKLKILLSPAPHGTWTRDPPHICFHSHLEQQFGTQSVSSISSSPLRESTPGSTDSTADRIAGELRRWLDPPKEEKSVEGLTPRVRRKENLSPKRLLIAMQGRAAEGAQGAQAAAPPEVIKYKCRIIRQVNTLNKMEDWEYNVRGKCLILGDSNVSRLPPCNMHDLQIDCFPGANFQHAAGLLAQVETNEEVHTVILAFGLNCRRKDPLTSTIPQLEEAIRMARLKFPRARIWTPLINYTNSLSPQELTNTETLNHYIEENCLFIPKLEVSQFSTGRDRIHWSDDTADRMLTHWLTYTRDEN